MSDYVVVGRVRRVWGVKGQLAIDWFDGTCPVDLKSENIFLKAGRQGALIKFTVSIDHPHGNHNIITLKEITDRFDAEKYRGSDIWVKKDRLPRLRDGEYYTYQLIEMRVENTEGEYLGDIKEIFSTGGSDVYVVKKGSEELLIPAIADVVKKVDVVAGLMVVSYEKN